MKLSESYINRLKNLAGIINEAANTDLELKSVAKQIFSVLKKHNLKPTYELDGKQYTSKAPATGYGARIALGNNGTLIVAVYDRGVWDTLKKGNVQELDMGNVSYPSPEERKQIEQKANIIYKDIVATLGQNNFEFRSNPKPDNYGNYIIQIRKKGQPAQQQQQQQQQQPAQQQQQQQPAQQQQQQQPAQQQRPAQPKINH